MISYGDHVVEDRRLVTLRLLRGAPGYSANESVIHSGLDALGHRVARSVVRADLDWLQEHSLVRIEMVSDIAVATLTERGADVATGRATVTGVKRPSAK